MMDAAGFSETLVHLYQNTRRHVSEDFFVDTAMRVLNVKFTVVLVFSFSSLSV